MWIFISDHGLHLVLESEDDDLITVRAREPAHILEVFPGAQVGHDVRPTETGDCFFTRVARACVIEAMYNCFVKDAGREELGGFRRQKLLEQAKQMIGHLTSKAPEGIINKEPRQ